MKKLFLFLLTFIISTSTFSQTKTDSLNNALRSASDQDKANIYIQLAKEFYYKDAHKLIYYSSKADSLSKIYKIDSTQVNALNYLSYASINTGKLDDAIAFNSMALELAKQKQLTKELISSEFYKGYYLYATGQPDSSIIQLTKAYDKAIDANYPVLQLNCLNTIAANYISVGKFEDAIKNFSEAYEIADSLNLSAKKVNLSLNIGTTLLYNEDIDKAIEYFKKTIAISDSTDVTIAYATALNNLGASYSALLEHEKALIYFRKALPAYNKLNNKLLVSQVYSNLGQSSYFLGKLDDASIYLNKAIELNRVNKSTNHLIVNLILLGEFKTFQKDYRNAKNCLDEAKQLIKESNINYNIADLSRMYSYYYSETNQLQKALEYKQIELFQKDSIFDETRQRQITELETQFQTQIKEKENENLRKDLALNKLEVEKQNQIRRFLIAIALLVIIVVVILLNRARVKKKALNIIAKQKLELEIANNTKDKFFAIIAHDLKSPFSALVGLCELLSESYDEISEDERKIFINDILEASNNTFSLLENLLTWSRIQQGKIKIEKKKISISDLIETSIRLHNTAAKLKKISIVNYVLINTIVFIDKQSVETVIVNLVNNALKFTHEGGAITINSEEQNDKFIISISDNGVGMTQHQIDQLFRIDESMSTPGTNKETGTGLGLILCKEFIELNNGEIWVESEKGKGSSFKFSLDKLQTLKV